MRILEVVAMRTRRRKPSTPIDALSLGFRRSGTKALELPTLCAGSVQRLSVGVFRQSIGVLGFLCRCVSVAGRRIFVFIDTYYYNYCNIALYCYLGN